MLYNSLKPLATILGGLFVSFLGALMGSLLLSSAVIGGHFVYTTWFAPDAVRDGQYETFALIGTVPYGAFLGALAATALTARYFTRFHGDMVTVALICLSGGWSTMACSGILILIITGISLNLTEVADPLIYLSVPFVAGASLVVKGTSLLVREGKQGI